MADLAALTADDFAPLVGDAFGLPTGDELVLRAVDRDGDPRPFSLRFDGPVEPVLAGQIVPLAHAALGTLELFVSPYARDAAATRYEAVFN